MAGAAQTGLCSGLPMTFGAGCDPSCSTWHYRRADAVTCGLSSFPLPAASSPLSETGRLWPPSTSADNDNTMDIGGCTEPEPFMDDSKGTQHIRDLVLPVVAAFFNDRAHVPLLPADMDANTL